MKKRSSLKNHKNRKGCILIRRRKKKQLIVSNRFNPRFKVKQG